MLNKSKFAFVVFSAALIAGPAFAATTPAQLQSQFNSASEAYRSAVEDLADGDETASARVKQLSDQMQKTIAECGKTKGCDLNGMLAKNFELIRWSVAMSSGEDMIGEDDEDGGKGVGNAYMPGGGAEVANTDAAELLSTKRNQFAQMVQYNPAIQASIRKWLTDMRGSLMNSYENYQYMRQYIAPAAEQHGLPEALMFGIMAKESNGKVHVSSRAGAAGPFQFMPATGKRFGLGNDGTGFDTRFDPRLSSQAAASYLTERMGELNRSIEMSLAAYNGGEGRALRIHKASGGQNFWNGNIYDQFPSETRDYVPMVIAAAWIYLHPRDYGVYFPKVSARPTTFKLQQPSSMYELAICLGNRGSRDGYFRALRNLNPRYEADGYLPAGTTLNATTRIAGLYNSYCVNGKRAQLTKQLMQSQVRQAVVRVGNFQTVEVDGSANVTPALPPPPKTYSVQTGETLTSISAKFQCPIGPFASANGLTVTSALKTGQVLKLETCNAP